MTKSIFNYLLIFSFAFSLLACDSQSASANGEVSADKTEKQKKKKGETTIRYEITNPNEYKELEEAITQALKESIDQITANGGSPCSSVPKRSTSKTEQITTS